MEFINKIELQGITSEHKALTARIEDKVFNHRFQVRTERHYTNRSGEPTIDITWFNVVVIPGTGSIPADWEPRTNAPIHIVGRLQYISPRYDHLPDINDGRFSDQIIPLSVLADRIEFLDEKKED